MTYNLKSAKDCDESTRILVFGYMKDAQLMLPYNENPYYNIPPLITHITLSYLNNYFNNTGVYTWKIHDIQMVHKMYNAKCGDKYESEIFDMSRLKWRIEVYPNGNKEELKGYFVIHLRLISLPSLIEKVFICRTFHVIENMSRSVAHFTLSKGGHSYWSNKCPLSELIDSKRKTITIEIQVDINRILLNNNDTNIINYDQYNVNNVPLTLKPNTKHQLMYKIKGKKLESFKKSKPGKLMCGELMDNIWAISVCPNGADKSNEGYIGIYLTICSFPPNTSKIKINFTFKCIETQKESSYFRYSWNVHNVPTCGDAKFMEFKSVINMDLLTFVCDVEILSIKEDKDPKYLEIADEKIITHMLNEHTL